MSRNIDKKADNAIHRVAENLVFIFNRSLTLIQPASLRSVCCISSLSTLYNRPKSEHFS